MKLIKTFNQFLTTTSSEAVEFTDTLLSVIRQQRHLGTRVVIATQEPTISPSLLDLCNVTIVHRFTSPAWYTAIEKHIAGAATAKNKKGSSEESDLFRSIVRLGTGEAFVFCPTALIDLAVDTGPENTEDTEECSEPESSLLADSGMTSSSDSDESEGPRVDGVTTTELGSGYMRVRIRNRVTADGGRSQLQK